MKWRVLAALVIPFVVASFFNACGRIGSPGVIAPDGDVLGLGKAVCEADLKPDFAQTYHPFLVSNCNSCHGNTHGSRDLNVAFRSFMEKGTALIDSQAVHAHGGNSLGSHMQPALDSLKPTWQPAETEYYSCLANAGASSSGESLRLNSIRIPSIFSTIPQPGQNGVGTWVKAKWDLSEDLAKGSPFVGRFDAIFEVEAKILMFGEEPVGVQFRNPTLRLKTLEARPFSMRGLKLFINDVQMEDVTTYDEVEAEVYGTDPVPLAMNMGSAISYYENIGLSTVFAFEIDSVTELAPGGGGGSSGGAGGSGSSGGGTTAPVIPDVVTHTQLVSTDALLGVFQANCVGCHGDTNPRKGLNLLDFTMSTEKAALIQQRMNDGNNPMPPSGLLDQTSRDIVGRWISSGLQQ